jgi:hypothetical protein
MSASDRPSGNYRPPKYLCQKCKDRPDRAYTRIDGKKVYLGEYGSEKSRAKYADLMARTHIASSTPDAATAPTVSELMAAYLVHVDKHCTVLTREELNQGKRMRQHEQWDCEIRGQEHRKLKNDGCVRFVVVNAKW